MQPVSKDNLNFPLDEFHAPEERYFQQSSRFETQLAKFKAALKHR